MTSSRNRQIIVSGIAAEQEILSQKPLNASTTSALSPEWQRWLVENHQLNIPNQQLLEIMVCEGVEPKIASDALKTLSVESDVSANTLQLSTGWRQWIQENQSRNVPDAILIETMVQKGVSVQVATYGVKAVRAQQKSYQSQNNQSQSNQSQNYQSENNQSENNQSQNTNIQAQLLAKLESVLAINQQLAELAPNYGTIERRERISKEEFLERYYATNTPVILTGMMQDWSAMSRWCPQYFKNNYGSTEVEIQTGRNADPEYEINANYHKKKVTLSEYVDMVVNGGETNDYYLVANNANLEREELKSLLNDMVFPEFMDSNDIRQRVFFWFGPAGTVTPLHHDPLNLMMAHVTGRKRWRLISPNYTPLLYNHIGVFSKVDLEKPDYEKYPLFKQARMMETVLEPGEIIFIPVGWWHQVKALDVSLSVSFTNFAFPNSYNYRNPNIRNSQPIIKVEPKQNSLPLTRPALTYEGVKNNLTDGYLVDEIFKDELLIISFGFVAWEGVPSFDFYGRTKKLEQFANRRINRILVRDFENAWYHRGVRGLGNNIDEVRDSLQKLIAEINPNQIVTIGQSMGAYAAILFGQLLGVDKVLAFGPLSNLNSQNALSIGDTRWLSVMQNLEANPPAKCYFDLLDENFIEMQSPNVSLRRTPKLDIFYGQKPDAETPGDINLDHFHAQRLAVLPNCTLHPYVESGHAVIQYLIDQELIDSVLLKALGWDVL
jgi:Cupin-like domain